MAIGAILPWLSSRTDSSGTSQWMRRTRARAAVLRREIWLGQAPGPSTETNGRGRFSRWGTERGACAAGDDRAARCRQGPHRTDKLGNPGAAGTLLADRPPDTSGQVGHRLEPARRTRTPAVQIHRLQSRHGPDVLPLN